MQKEVDMERRIEATELVRASVGLVARVLTGRGSALGERHPRSVRGPASYVTDVEVGLGGGSSVHEQVTIRCIRQFEGPKDSARWDLSWEPVGHERLLPAFRGHLQAVPAGAGTQLHLAGTYRPPLGPVGAAGDALVGHRVAERTLASLLAGLAGRIDREADARREALDVTPAPYPEDLRDKAAPSESWLG
jgi:hypothetical protein